MCEREREREREREIFIHSSVGGYLGCFHVLTIINNAVRNTEVNISFQTSIFIFIDECSYKREAEKNRIYREEEVI